MFKYLFKFSFLNKHLIFFENFPDMCLLQEKGCKRELLHGKVQEMVSFNMWQKK